jgi:hypothetical protein
MPETITLDSTKLFLCTLTTHIMFISYIIGPLHRCIQTIWIENTWGKKLHLSWHVQTFSPLALFPKQEHIITTYLAPTLCWALQGIWRWFKAYRKKKPGMVVHTCNHGTWEAKEEDQVFNASLRPWIKTKERKVCGRSRMQWCVHVVPVTSEAAAGGSLGPRV